MQDQLLAIVCENSFFCCFGYCQRKRLPSNSFSLKLITYTYENKLHCQRVLYQEFSETFSKRKLDGCFCMNKKKKILFASENVPYQRKMLQSLNKV